MKSMGHGLHIYGGVYFFAWFFFTSVIFENTCKSLNRLCILHCQKIASKIDPGY